LTVAKTIKEIADEVCDRVTVNAPSTIFGTNDRIARLIRTGAKDTIREMMREAGRNGVSGFRSQWAFATRPNTYAYQLPTDFYRMIPNSEQRGKWPLGILGPVSPQTWSNWIAGSESVAVPMGWRIKNNLFHLEPPPKQAEIIIIEYLSRFMVVRNATDDDLEPVGGYLQPKVPLVPREGFLSSDALDTVPTSNASQWGTATWGSTVWGSLPEYELRRIPTTTDETDFPAYQVRAEEFTKDEDMSALDDDYVLSLGISWRLQRGLRMPYNDLRDEYNRELEGFLAHDATEGRDVIFGEDRPHNEIEPLGGGNWIIT
jgi:hypothetical protein